MNQQIVERYWSLFKRYLPVLRILEGKEYGLLLIQIHEGRPVKKGFLPGLEAVDKGGAEEDASDE